MKRATATTEYLSNIYRAITESTSVKNPCYGYFVEMVKMAVIADGGVVIGTTFFTCETNGLIIDSDEIYEWFSKK